MNSADSIKKEYTKDEACFSGYFSPKKKASGYQYYSANSKLDTIIKIAGIATIIVVAFFGINLAQSYIAELRIQNSSSDNGDQTNNSDNDNDSTNGNPQTPSTNAEKITEADVKRIIKEEVSIIKIENEVDPIFSKSTGASITPEDLENWNLAYSWGNHSDAKYLKSFSEADPIFNASPAKSITNAQKTNWNLAYSWGNHALAGYLKTFSELDPTFTSSVAATINNSQVSNWNSAYSWGNHADAGYLTALTAEIDPVFSASIASGITVANVNSWNTAYSWGNHADAGYLTALTAEIDPVFTASPAYGITGTNITNWNSAHSWGNHALAGYLTSFTELDPVFGASSAASITNTDITNWNSAYSWGNHTSAGYLTTYTETDPTFTASPSAGISGTNITNWNTAYGWGNHADAGYLTSIGAETDPVYGASSAATITGTDITNWDSAFSWGNHALAGYITSFTELDSVFVASPAYGITATNVTNWDTAYSWGNHASAGYLTSFVETDSIFLASPASTITNTNITNWGTAYTWGNHATAGYLTTFTETDPTFTASPSAGITGTNITNWNSAYSWGNHASAGYLTSFTELDPIYSASSAATITNTDIANWDLAYSWGDHNDVGYLTSYTETDAIFMASVASTITVSDPNNWDTAYSWGNHATQGYLTTAITSLNGLTGASQTFATGSSGTDVGITSTGTTHILNIPTASATNRGALSSTDWTTFNSKLGTALTSARIFVGNGSNVATAVAVSGDATLSNTGALTLATTGVTAGTYNNITVDAKGRATGGSNIAYLTSFTETDPIYGASPAAGITGTNITNWNTAYSWGNHAIQGYLTTAITSLNGLTSGTQTFAVGTAGTDIAVSSATSTHTINIPTASAANRGALSSTDWTTFNSKLGTALTSARIFVGNGSNVATAVAVSGDATLSNTGALTLATTGVTAGTYNNITVDAKGRATGGSNVAYLTSFTETDPIYGASPSAGITGTNITNWNTAYGWGNHASAGYLTAEADTLATVTGRGASTATAVTMTGGITISGATSINNSASTSTTNIGTGTTTGGIAIGGGSNTLAINTSSWDINSAGAASGLTGITSSGTVTFTGLAAGTTETTVVLRNASNQLVTRTLGSNAFNSTAFLTTAVTSLNGLTASTQTFAVGTAGTDIAVSSATSTHTINIPTASATNRGALSSTDWTTFNSKLGTALTSANIFVGNGSNVATAVAVSGDATLSNTGALTLATTGITAGTYNNITVDAKGRATGGSNVAYLTVASPVVADNVFRIQDNTDPTKQIAFEASSITTATTRTFTLPNASTTLVGTDNTATLTNKTVNATNNTITDTSTANGDLLVSDGTKFVRMARGTANQFLKVNTAGTGLEYGGETDPLYSASTASGITSTHVTNWTAAYNWGNHATQGYLTSASLPNLYNRFTDGTNTATTASQTDIFRFVAGSNITLLVGNNHGTYGDYIQINSTDQYLGTVTTVTTGSGLSGGAITNTGTIQISAPTCSGTDKLQWNGSAFLCATDQNTTYTASTGLTLSGGAFSLNSTLSNVTTITRASSNLTLSTTTTGDIILDAAGTVKIGATGTGKLDVGTIDPPYTINGEKYATYMPSMIGVKEELSGVIKTKTYILNKGYRYTLNFKGQEKGSDLWLFARTANIKDNFNELSVILSPGSQASVWYELDYKNYAIHIYTSKPSPVSYRLTSPRFDADKWENTRDQNGSEGFVLNYPDEW